MGIRKAGQRLQGYAVQRGELGELDLLVNQALDKAEQQDALILAGKPYDTEWGLLEELDRIGALGPYGTVDIRQLHPETVARLEDRFD